MLSAALAAEFRRILIWFALVYASQLQASSSTSPETYSVYFHDVPVTSAIQILAELSGRNITVRGKASELKVSFSLEKETLEVGLERCLDQRSYILNRFSDGSIDVYLLGRGPVDKSNARVEGAHGEVLPPGTSWRVIDTGKFKSIVPVVDENAKHNRRSRQTFSSKNSSFYGTRSKQGQIKGPFKGLHRESANQK